MGDFIRRVYYLLNRRRLNAELQNDMEFHREMAARAGSDHFGNTLRLREQAHEAWGWTWLDRLKQDLSYGVRILLRSPGFTFVTVLVLSIGIGANATAFSLFDMIALKPLPVPDADRIVRLERRSLNDYNSEMAYPSFLFYREHSRTLSAAMAVLGVPPMQIDNDLQPSSASFVTANYFSELSAHPAYGRLLSPGQDDNPNAPPAVVLSYGLWQRRFGSDPNVVGRVVRLNKKAATIAGVTPFNFASLGGQNPDLWMPIVQQPYFVEHSTFLSDWNSSSVRMWGKLAPGVSARAAEQELRGQTAELRRQHPNAAWDGEYIQSSPGGHLQVMQPAMYQVAAMVGALTLLILIVCCANLGGLMLARAVTRQREFEIRTAIGANRLRILRQLCTESILFAAIAAVVGLVLSCAILRVVLVKIDAPKWLGVWPDGRVLLFTTCLTATATILLGLLPGLQVLRQRQHKMLARQVLVGAQIAASSILLIVAALLLRATHHALFTDPGFGYEQLVSIDPQLGHHAYTPAAAGEYLDRMEERLRGLPGTISVGLVKLPPLGHVVSSSQVKINGEPVTVYPNWVSPDFFRTMGIPLRMGRTFYAGETNAVVISESFARRQWPSRNPLGQFMGEGATTDIVIGVAGDAHINALSDDDATEQYWPAQPGDMPDMVVMVRGGGEPGSLTPSIRGISENLDPAVLPEIRQVEMLYRQNIAQIEMVATIVSLVGALAASIAAVGIIGLVAFVVTQRTKEIAIRIALGASPVAVVRAVLRQFRWPVILGLAAGTGLAAFGSKLLREGLYGVSNLDPASYAVACGTLAVIVALAMILPAGRTLRLDLAKILHCE